MKTVQIALTHFEISIFILVYYPNVGEATKAVENGEAWGVISVGGNFSEKLYEVHKTKNKWPYNSAHYYTLRSS